MGIRPQQLTVVQAQELNYVFFDAFYSTGKTTLLKHRAEYLHKKKKVVHYFVHTTAKSTKLPFTMMLEQELRSRPKIRISETTFQFGKDSIKDFLRGFSIQPSHHICFDELICHSYTKEFCDALEQMRENVSSMWIAIGAKPTIAQWLVAIRSLYKSPDSLFSFLNGTDYVQLDITRIVRNF